MSLARRGVVNYLREICGNWRRAEYHPIIDLRNANMIIRINRNKGKLKFEKRRATMHFICVKIIEFIRIYIYIYMERCDSCSITIVTDTFDR